MIQNSALYTHSQQLYRRTKCDRHEEGKEEETLFFDDFLDSRFS